jgi:hypothetical protein
VRFFGVSFAFELFLPGKDENDEEIEVTGSFTDENGEEKAINVTKEAAEWTRSLVEQGVRLVINEKSIYNSQDNSFVLPSLLNEVPVDIGDKIVFGEGGDFIVVRVTGWRDDTEKGRIVYCKPVPM